MKEIDTIITGVLLTSSPDRDLGIVITFDGFEVKPFARVGVSGQWLAKLVEALGTGAVTFGEHPRYRCRVRVANGTVQAIGCPCGCMQWLDVRDDAGAGVPQQRPPTRGEKALAYYNGKRARIGAKPLVICDEYTEDDAIADARLYGWDG